MDESEPTQDQLDLSDLIIQELTPVLNEYCLKHASSALSRYFGEVIFLNGEQFVRVSWSDFPTDYPGVFGIEIGWNGPRPRWVRLSEIVSRANGTPHKSSLLDIRQGRRAFQTIVQDFVQYASPVLGMTSKQFKDWLGPDDFKVIWEDRTPKS